MAEFPGDPVSPLQSRTPGGAIAFSEYLAGKGYATTAQVNPWRTAIQKVFETVEGEGWEQLDLASIDLDEYLRRFQTLAGAQYKAESITAYGRRIKNAIEAHEHYLSTGKPPTFRAGPRKAKADEAASLSKAPVVNLESKATPKAAPPAVPGTPSDGMVDFPYPLGDGRMVTLRLPPRLKSDDVNRITAFIRTLQDDSAEPRQIPRRTGEDEDHKAA
jgi:GH24 family phage-related lysozyme (muramidase)